MRARRPGAEFDVPCGVDLSVGCACEPAPAASGGKCVPKPVKDLCAAKGAQCGFISDGCGGSVKCGTCPLGQDCATDGVANRCGPPSIPVFVIGVGEELTALNAIAEAGGTKSAAVIATSGNVTEAFLAALDGIRRSALSCNYDIPPPKSGDIDYSAVNVTFRQGSSKPSTLFYVKAAADCELQPEQGWYYDDPKNPTQVVLCPQTCERVSAASDARMDVAFGCKRNDVVR